MQASILKGVDFTLYGEEAVAITGRSGEGKSTLLQIFGTLEQPCAGRLEIANTVVTPFTKAKIRNRHIAFVFQSFHLLEDYTVLENVLMPAWIARQRVCPGSAAHQRACELLELVGLSNRMTYYTKLLSGGEKQRVAIARALCNDPDLILADEPSGNLDKKTAETIHSTLLNFARRKKKGVLFVTHDMSLAEQCDRRFLLQGGVLTEM